MHRRSFLALSLAGTSVLAFPQIALAKSASAKADVHPLLAPWTGPFGGLPPFDKVTVADFAPAFEAAMAQHRTEIAAITRVRSAGTFANTIVPLERAGAALDRAGRIYGVFTSLASTPELREVQKQVAPRLAAHGDAITQDAALFARIEQVWAGRDRLSPGDRRATWRWRESFVRAGALLPPEKKARVAEINQRMAVLHARFQENLLADETLYTELTEAQMSGLSDAVKSALRAEAKSRNLTAPAVVPNRGGSVGPFLQSADDRAARETVFKLFKARGDLGGATDNNAIVAEILKLRAERSRLLGARSYAHWRLTDTMAKTPEAAMALLESLWAPAVKRVGEEVADMQKLADAEGKGVTIAPWDMAYYGEKVRRARYDVNLAEARPYLQLDRLREGMFWVATQMHGLTFHEMTGVATVHPDVRVWEVRDAAGKHKAVWYFDPFARSGKRSGAWASAYRTQQHLDGPITAITSNNSNFQKPAPGEPLLIDWNAASTLFHEFGHAVHGMLQDIPYASLANLPRDYVEFPSQIMENWLTTDEVLSRFALHHETGQPMPKELIAKIKAAEKHGQGIFTVSLAATALMDMKMHMDPDGDIDPDAFERETLAALGLPAQAYMVHRVPQAYHFFSSENYAAGYYGYVWSDALVADASEAFEKAPGGYFDTGMATRFREQVLTKGNLVDPAEQYRAFMGRDVDTGALMRKKGFV